MHTCTHGWVDVDFLQCQSAFASAVCGRMQSHISARKSLRVFLTPIPHSGPRTHSPLLPHLTPHQQIPRLQWLVCRSRASHARGTRVSRVLGSMHLSKPAMHASPPASRTPAQSRPAARPRTTSRSQPRIRSDAAPAPPVASPSVPRHLLIQFPQKHTEGRMRPKKLSRVGPELEGAAEGAQVCGPPRIKRTSRAIHSQPTAWILCAARLMASAGSGTRDQIFWILRLVARGGLGGSFVRAQRVCVRAVGLWVTGLVGACMSMVVCLRTAGFCARGRPSSRLAEPHPPASLSFSTTPPCLSASPSPCHSSLMGRMSRLALGAASRLARRTVPVARAAASRPCTPPTAGRPLPGGFVPVRPLVSPSDSARSVCSSVCLCACLPVCLCACLSVCLLCV